MNVKKIIILASLFLMVCATWTYADTYHYSDRIEIDGDEVMVSGSPWTTSQNASDKNLTDINVLEADEFNTILYVEAGNATDVQAKIDSCAVACIIDTPNGDYTFSSTLNVSKKVIIQGHGPETRFIPASDIDVVHMNSSYSRLENLMVRTDPVMGYSSSGILFDDSIDYGANWVYLRDVYVHGNFTGANNGDKAVSMIDNSGSGITWVVTENVIIKGYTYGIYMESNHASAYVNGNIFNNYQCVLSKYCLYQNEVSGEINGNVYDIRVNGASNSEYAYHVEGDYNTFHTITYDVSNFNLNIAYNFTSSSRNNWVYDNLVKISENVDSGTDNSMIINDVNSFGEDVDMNYNNIIDWINVSNIKKDMILFYGFEINDASSPYVYDTSREGVNAIRGSSVVGDSQEPSFVSGLYGTSMKFDGVNDYLNTTKSDNLTAFTFCVDYNLIGKTDFGKILSGGDRTYLYWRNGYNYMRFYDGEIGLFMDFTTGVGGTLNKWYSMCVYGDGTTAYAYIDDVLVSTETYDGAVKHPLYIGSKDGTQNYFNGTLDNVRIYDRIVGRPEIRAYSLGFEEAAIGHKFDKTGGAVTGNVTIAADYLFKLTANTTQVYCNANEEGNVYYDGGVNKLRVCDGTNWANCN